jgi:hypothetical protein
MRKCKCGKIIHETSIRCRSCEAKRKHIEGILFQTNFKGGPVSRIKYCTDCNKRLNDSAYYRGNKRCNKCSKIGKLNNFFGKKLTESHREKISLNHADVKGKNNPMFGKISHGKGEYYKYIWMRSSWEVNFAKWCDKKNIKWQYEPKTFDLGNTTYTPDFYVPIYACYIEIKGYWRTDAKKKFNLFNKIYPKEEIVILQKNELLKLGVL